MQWEGFVVYTRLTPLRVLKRTLHRPRLLNHLKNALDYPLTIVQAGAGYGKSTALAALGNEPIELVWYQLDAEDTDPFIFLLYLLHGFYRTMDNLPRRHLALLEVWDGTVSALPWQLVIDGLVNDLLSIDRPILLILDDAQIFNLEPALASIIERLIKHAPAHLHIILSTRYPLNLESLPAMRIRGEVLEVDQKDLKFTPGEIARLFDEHYGVQLHEAEVALVAEETGGWAIALQLIWQGMTESVSSGVIETLHRMPTLKDDLFSYLAHEVLSGLSAELQEFLLITAVLRRMTPTICDCLRESDNSAGQLQHLTDMGLFVQELADDTIQYHPLFQEFLYNRLSDDQRHAFHLRSAACYAQQGENEEAVYHYIRAGAYTRAAALIVSLGRTMVERGLLETLAGWIGALPPADLEAHPVLLVYLGDIARLHSRFDEALGWYQQAEERFRALSDNSGIGQALRGQARVYLDTVSPAQAESLLRKALRLSDGQEDRQSRANLLELMAENQLNRGDSAEAKALREQAHALREEGPGYDELDVRVMLRTGRLDEARIELERRAAIEREEPVMRPRAHRETLLLLSFILSCQGRSEEAYQAAMEGTARGKALESPFITAVGYMRQGHAWLLRDGDNIYDEARRCFEDAIELSDSLAVARMKIEAYWGLCRIYGFQGNLDLGNEMAHNALVIGEEVGDEWIMAGVSVTMGAAHVMSGQYEEAASWLQRAHSSYRACADTYGEANARLWQCLLWDALDDGARLEQGLDDLFNIVQAHDYDHLFTSRHLGGPPDVHRLVPLLLAARDTDHADYADMLLKRLGLQHVIYHPGYQLRVQTLGTFQVWRGQMKSENEIDDWQREKARQMFLLLIASRGTLVDKSRLADQLWPDLPPDSADQNFRVTLNALYRALQPHRKRSAPSAYIVRDGSMYGLRPEADLWLDVEQFEMHINTGDNLLESDTDACIDQYRAATKLYGGDFLGEFIYEEDWWREETERLRDLYRRTADRLAQLLIDREAWEEAIEVCQAIIRHDDWWERAYRLLMRAYAELGNRPQAIRVYQQLTDKLAADLDTVPSPETTHLYQTLLEPTDQKSE